MMDPDSLTALRYKTFAVSALGGFYSYCESAGPGFRRDPDLILACWWSRIAVIFNVKRQVREPSL